MKRKLTVLFVAVFVALFSVVPASARRGNETPGVVYVTSQGLYYDTFVVKDPLPFQGRFQKIENGTTEFGPGDPRYLVDAGRTIPMATTSWMPPTITSSARCSARDARNHNGDLPTSVG